MVVQVTEIEEFITFHIINKTDMVMVAVDDSHQNIFFVTPPPPQIDIGQAEVCKVKVTSETGSFQYQVNDSGSTKFQVSWTVPALKDTSIRPTSSGELSGDYITDCVVTTPKDSLTPIVEITYTKRSGS